MLVDDVTTCLDAGASINVGLVHDDGRPLATRAFGLRVLRAEPLRVELHLPEAALLAVGRPPGGPPFAMAATVSAIVLFRSIQLKGQASGVRVPTPEEVAEVRSTTERYFAILEAAHIASLQTFAATLPERLLTCTLDVTEAFEQTPGPGAGRPMGLGR